MSPGSELFPNRAQDVGVRTCSRQGNPIVNIFQDCFSMTGLPTQNWPSLLISSDARVLKPDRREYSRVLRLLPRSSLAMGGESILNQTTVCRDTFLSFYLAKRHSFRGSRSGVPPGRAGPALVAPWNCSLEHRKVAAGLDEP